MKRLLFANSPQPVTPIEMQLIKRGKILFWGGCQSTFEYDMWLQSQTSADSSPGGGVQTSVTCVRDHITAQSAKVGNRFMTRTSHIFQTCQNSPFFQVLGTLAKFRQKGSNTLNLLDINIFILQSFALKKCLFFSSLPSFKRLFAHACDKCQGPHYCSISEGHTRDEEEGIWDQD